MKTIIISGRKQSGKSTLAETLSRNLDFSCRFNFADGLKEMCVMFGIDPFKLYGSNDDKNTQTHIQWNSLPFDTPQLQRIFSELRPNIVFNSDDYITIREFLVIFGTYICRHIENNCWVNNTINRINTEENERYILGTQIDYVIIDDARFPNEIDRLLGPDTYLIRLLRNPYNDDNKVEKALDNYDWSKINPNNLLILDNSNMSIEDKDNFVLRWLNERK